MTMNEVFAAVQGDLPNPLAASIALTSIDNWTIDIEDVASPKRQLHTSITSARVKRRRAEPMASALAPVADVEVKVPQVTPTPSASAMCHLEPSAPPNWKLQFESVKEMRAPGGIASGAPVDTMGCERQADPAASLRDQRLQCLVALMLSPQTTDANTADAMQQLKTKLPSHKSTASPGLNLENLLHVNEALLLSLISRVGFRNVKTKNLKRMAEMLRDRWEGDIPDTIKGLTDLPGVGPKIAHLCMTVAWDRTEGIGVDLHVHRLTNLWRWHETTKPEATRLALESWLPYEHWREINHLLVGFGQTMCPTRRQSRSCSKCLLGLRGLCEAADLRKP